MHALTRRTARAASVALALLLGLGAQAQPAAIDPLRQADAAAIAAARGAVARENPQLMKAITRGGSFSGESFSQAIANNMYSRSDAAAIADARAKLANITAARQELDALVLSTLGVTPEQLKALDDRTATERAAAR